MRYLCLPIYNTWFRSKGRVRMSKSTCVKAINIVHICNHQLGNEMFLSDWSDFMLADLRLIFLTSFHLSWQFALTSPFLYLFWSPVGLPIQEVVLPFLLTNTWQAFSESRYSFCERIWQLWHCKVSYNASVRLWLLSSQRTACVLLLVSLIFIK